MTEPTLYIVTVCLTVMLLAQGLDIMADFASRLFDARRDLEDLTVE